MNMIYSGAAALLAGAGTMYFTRRRNEPVAEPRTLSASCEALLETVCQGQNPADEAKALTNADISAIWINSRLYLCMANRARLSEPQDKELSDIFRLLHKEHAKIRWLILLAIIEQIVGRLGLGRVTMYHRMLLWTYGGELDLLDLISQKSEGTAVPAIL